MLRKLINIIYFVTCFSGFSWQVWEICAIYFKYDVTSQVMYQVPLYIHAPGITLCYRYIELLDYPAMNAMKGKNWINDSFNASTIREIQQSLTIEEVFKLTPSEKDAIKGCAFRRPGSYELFEYQTPAECNKNFKVVKFFILEYICYKYQFLGTSNSAGTDAKRIRPKNVFSLQELANTPAAAGQIYRLEIPKIFDFMLISKFLLHPQDRFPYKEVEYATVMESNRINRRTMVTEAGESPEMAVGKYSLSYFTLEILRLPPPFVQQCFNYSTIDRQSRTDCHQRCVKEKSEQVLNMIPFSSIETRSMNKTSISYLELQNSTFVDLLYQMYQECDQVCHRKDCDEYTYFTRTSYRSQDRGLTFHTFIPSEPSIKVTSKEILTMTELISFILSTFGTWFGISVLALNPFNFKLKKSDTHGDDGHGDETVVHSGNSGYRGQIINDGRRMTKLGISYKSKNDDELQQLIITLTGRVTKIEKFVHAPQAKSFHHSHGNSVNSSPNSVRW